MLAACAVLVLPQNRHQAACSSPDVVRNITPSRTSDRRPNGSFGRDKRGLISNFGSK